MLNLKALLADERGHLAVLSEERINPALCKALKVLGYNKQYTRGKGAYLFDEAGNRYVDCLSGFGTFACGRNHPAIREALKQTMDLDLPNLVAMGVASLSGLLARELINLAPGALEMVFFTNSGTEGVETAIKYARAATGKSRIVHCKRSFHGLSLGSLSVNGNEEFKEGFGPMLEPTSAVPFNDLAALERELARGDVAGFIVEPIQGKGVFVPSDRYLPDAAALCRKHKALFIADEVQTGLGRTGKMFACEHWGVEPDILIVAKALSGGYMPVGAVLSKRWIHEKVFSRLDRCFVHSSTFTENDLAMAAGLATLSVLRDEKLVENAAAMGNRLADRLRAVGSRYEMFGEVRGRGLMVGIEFRPPTSLSLKMGWNLLHKLDSSLFCQAMLIPLLSEHHVLAQVAGHHLDVIKLLPSLVVNEDDVDYVVQAFDQVMAACHRFPGPVWEVGKRLAGAQLRN
ncbi:MAG TPA: aspartate aminotransferase family protein [Planctomycetaceae bacterium]|jgi:ornithine--oxo-acid transaminase|nr:aspartate aminotransferase family protein [Planctomycetaceae bacterium]